MQSHSLITLREAVPQDRELLEFWDKQPHVIAAAPNDEFDWEAELTKKFAWRELLIAELDHQPIGFIQIIDPAEEETHYWGKVSQHLRAIDIWIGEKDNLGKGYGTQMMQLAIKRCFANSTVTGILIDPLASNTRAQKFYEKNGFVFIEQRQFDEDTCYVYRLDRKL